MTGAEVTKYKPCQKVTITFDGTPPMKRIKNILGDFLPSDDYLNGRTVFKHKNNPKIQKLNYWSAYGMMPGLLPMKMMMLSLSFAVLQLEI